MNEKQATETAPAENPDGMLALGAWLGRHQAFGLIANRCTAAEAECLKTMRDSGGYKKLGLNWEEFCEQHAGVSRVYADKLIRHLDEFGANYFRLAELIQISSDTYRLIAGAMSDEGFAFEGTKIPLVPENRRRILGAVQAMRAGRPSEVKPVRAGSVGKRLDAVIADARAAAGRPSGRKQVLAVLERGRDQLTELMESLRRAE